MTLTLTTEIVVNRDLLDDDISRLHREATVHKESKEWSKAVACLQQANELMIQSSVSYGTERWLRLPTFLQQAGDMHEAGAVFQWLMTDLERRVNKEFGHASSNVQAVFKHSSAALIYDKWRLAWKREKRADKADFYAGLVAEQQELENHYREKVEQERKLKSTARTAKQPKLTGERNERASNWLPNAPIEAVDAVLPPKENRSSVQEMRTRTVSRPQSSMQAVVSDNGVASAARPEKNAMPGWKSKDGIEIGLGLLLIGGLIAGLVVWLG